MTDKAIEFKPATPTEITIDTIQLNQLFRLPGYGVLRKTGSMIGTDRSGKVRVVYPTDTVLEFQHKPKN